MKNKLKKAAMIGCAALCAIACAGCGAGAKSSRLGKPKEGVTLTSEQLADPDFNLFFENVDSFSSEFASETVISNEKANFAVSPISAYMALALAAECADGTTRSQILTALDTTYGSLSEHFPSLFNMLDGETKIGGKTASALRLTNSLWVNEGVTANDGCIKNLSEKFYAYSYAAPFSTDNDAANKAVKNFVKEQTKGLINADFGLSPETVFTLINTLYLKDIWDLNSDGLRFSGEAYAFTNGDGSVKQTKLLVGNYLAGRVLDFGEYKAFYTETYSGYRIKFILPSAGKSVRSVFTAANIRAVNSADFSGNAVDAAQNFKYFTRCLFPAFSTSCDADLKPVMQNKFGITELFDPAKCNFTNLTQTRAYCSQMRHAAKLKVDEKGVEGAAVTVTPMLGAPAPEYTNKYEELVLDRAFGFILTDKHNVELFAGVADKL